MAPKYDQNRSKIDAKIDQKIDAKLKAQKSIKNRALERQGVAKGTSALQRRQVSWLDGPLTVGKKDSKTARLGRWIPTRRWAQGPANIPVSAV